MRREWKYLSDEMIRVGDVVKLGALDGIVVELVWKDSPSWVEYIGEGVVLEGPSFGRIHTPFLDEDLVLIKRKSE